MTASTLALALARALALACEDSSLSVLCFGTQIVIARLDRPRCNSVDPASALADFCAAAESLGDPLRGDQVQPIALGWLGYDALRHDEPQALSDARPVMDHAPLAWLADIAEGVVVHSETDSYTLLGDSDRAAKIHAKYAHIDALTSEDLTPWVLKSDTDASTHGAQVREIQAQIAQGEVYLVNLARGVWSEQRASEQEIAKRVLRSRAPYAALLRAEGVTVGAMSMELGLRFCTQTRTLVTCPIKGTRPRGQDLDTDLALARELSHSPKERAENTMAVDVHRNDLGRVSEVGSVQVTALCEAQAHAFVHHLVSTVTATKDPAISLIELLSSVLPLGSVTGAPKRAAMRQIAALESQRRGLYTGVYGVLLANGSLELAVSIRCMVSDAHGTHYGAGGGIVLDSDPAQEWAELSWKEQAIASAQTPSTRP
ncbi:MAG: anthranilate synthase component I family protein [Deltaproteobacteria bacterium]|nr:anthranilate synthase component I family protein [Deltaproteobacteria bacterium]